MENYIILHPSYYITPFLSWQSIHFLETPCLIFDTKLWITPPVFVHNPGITFSFPAYNPGAAWLFSIPSLGFPDWGFCGKLDFVLITGLFTSMVFNSNMGLRWGFTPDPTRVLNTLDPH